MTAGSCRLLPGSGCAETDPALLQCESPSTLNGGVAEIPLKPRRFGSKPFHGHG